MSCYLFSYRNSAQSYVLNDCLILTVIRRDTSGPYRLVVRSSCCGTAIPRRPRFESWYGHSYRFIFAPHLLYQPNSLLGYRRISDRWRKRKDDGISAMVNWCSENWIGQRSPTKPERINPYWPKIRCVIDGKARRLRGGMVSPRPGGL